jgi:HEAT repeat protein
MRWKAVIACGEIGDPRAVDSLLSLLCDEGHVVKSRTGRALGLIGEAAVDLLIRSLRDGDGSLLCHPLRPQLAGFV